MIIFIIIIIIIINVVDHLPLTQYINKQELNWNESNYYDNANKDINNNNNNNLFAESNFRILGMCLLTPNFLQYIFLALILSSKQLRKILILNFIHFPHVSVIFGSVCRIYILS